MSRINLLESNNAPQNIVALYEAVNQKLGLLPNMVKALGNSEAALQGYLGLSGAVGSGTLRPSTREKIALLVAERNACEYCLRAHTAIGGLLKIPSDELLAARRGESSDNKEQALLSLAGAILSNRGDVPGNIQSAVEAAGVTEAEAAEVVANVAVNIFTNYFNRYAQTENDFPAIEACEIGCACH